MSRDYFARKDGLGGTATQLKLGLLILAMGVVGVALGHSMFGMQLFVGVGLLVTRSWAVNNPLLRLHDDHLEMKLAMAAPRHFLHYRDLSLLEDAPERVFLATSAGQRLRLPLTTLAEPGRSEIVGALKQRIAASRKSA